MLILDKQRAVARIVALTDALGLVTPETGRRVSTGGRSYRGIATYERRPAAPVSVAEWQSARRRSARQRADQAGGASAV